MLTKACNLTETEIEQLLMWYGARLYVTTNINEHIERINYLHKRLKSFKEIETVVEEKPKAEGWG